MKIISFAWTTPALRAGRKTVTRRHWDPKYALRFHQGDRVLAYDRSPCIGGRPVAEIELTADPTWEANAAMPDSDYEAEGYAYMHEQAQLPRALPQDIASPELFRAWQRGGEWNWVVRFKLIRLIGDEEKGGR